MNNGRIIYRLRRGNPFSWQLPITGMRMTKEVKVGETIEKHPKFVAYYPGSSSLFVEDNEKADRKKKNIWFSDKGNGHTEFHADADDILLNRLLQNHPKFNKSFYIYDPEEQAKRDIERQKQKSGLSDQIMSSPDYDVKGMAFGVFGYMAFAWGPARCRAELLNRLDKGEKDNMEDGVSFIAKKFEMPDYKAKLTAGAAYYAGIIEENATNNYVMWSDTGEHIVNLSIGEIGVEKLSNLLSVKTEDSYRVWQRIGDTLNKKFPTKPKDAVKTSTVAEEEANKGIVDPEILELQEQYRAKFGKEPWFIKQHDKEWLQKQLAK